MPINVFASGANRRADAHVYASGANRQVKEVWLYTSGVNRRISGQIVTLTCGSAGTLRGFNTGGTSFGSVSPSSIFGGSISYLYFGLRSGVGTGLHISIATATDPGLTGVVINGITWLVANGFKPGGAATYYWPTSETLTHGQVYPVVFY